MSKTRFTPWVVLACIGTLAGCTSGEGGTAGNTDLNIVLPNGCAQDTSAPDCFDIQVVEYTIACDDGDPTPNGPFLDNNAGFDDRVVINGVLEVFDTPQPGRDGRAASGDPWTWGNTLGDIYVAQGFMDLPVTQNCTAQLRARTAPTTANPDGEVICTDTVTFGVEADTVSTVNVLMYCGLSFQAPVAQLDLAGDFSFNVSNFCPDAFVLNCIDTDIDVRATPLGDFAVTACQTRFRDGDSQCGDSCDPQTCTTAPEGLRCTPGPDPAPTPGTATPGAGVSTTVSCFEAGGGAIINCDGLGQPSPTGNCVFAGDTLGVIGGPPPGPPPFAGGPGPGPGGFFVACILCDQNYVDASGGLDPRCPTPTGLPLTPGATVTCSAITTDGDQDCDKIKTVELTCPGLTPCQGYADAGFVCDDGSECTIDSCNDALADPDTGCGTADNGPCCTTAPVPNVPAIACDDFDPQPGLCIDGACEAQGCTVDGDCPVGDGNCLGDSSCVNFVCTQRPPTNDQGPCDNSGEGSGVGVCDATGVCNSTDTCGTAGDPVCADTDECNLGFCDESSPPWACGTDPTLADGDPCNSGAGVCNNGSCEIPPLIGADDLNTGWRAAPVLCADEDGVDVDGNPTGLPSIPICDAQSTNAGDPCPNGNSDCGDTPCDGPDAVSCNGNCLTDAIFEFIDGPTGRGGPRAGCELCLSNSCGGGSRNGLACDTVADCPGAGTSCEPGTPDPPDCELDCFTATCTNIFTPVFIIPAGAPLSAAVYPGQVESVPVRGCEVVSGTLQNQLAIDTNVFLDVNSDGDNNLTTTYNIQAANGGLALAGPLANLFDVTIVTTTVPATPSFITQKLDPALQNTPTSDYIAAGIFTLTPADLPPVPQKVIPDGPPNLVVNFDPAGILIELVIVSNGAPLNITGDSCTFQNPVGTCLGGSDPFAVCDPNNPGTTCAGSFPDPDGTCVATDGGAMTFPVTQP